MSRPRDMTILVQTPAHSLSPAVIAIVAVGGIILLIIALKIGRMIAKLFLGLMGLALLGGAVWWFFFRH